MKKIFKGYEVAGNGYHTGIIFKTEEEYKSLEEFLQEEYNFKEFLEEYEYKITEDNFQELANKYNEDDDLGMYYSIEKDLDNTKEYCDIYKTNDVDLAINLHKEYTELLEEYESTESNYDEIEEFEGKYNL